MGRIYIFAVILVRIRSLISPTTIHWWVVIGIENYGWKESNMNICGLSASMFVVEIYLIKGQT